MQIPSLSRHVLVLSLTALAAAAAQAGDMYLSVGGLKGESVALKHEGAIEINSLQWGLSTGTSLTTGGGAGVGKPTPSDIAWTQGLDNSVVGLAKDLTTGKSRTTGSFQLVKSNNLSGTPWLSLNTTDQFMTSLNFANADIAASAVAKTISLSYNPEAAAGASGTGKTVTTSWDVSKGTVTGSGIRKPTGPVNDLKGPAAASGGAVSMYLRLGSGNDVIAGDSRKGGYENWIELGSAAFGLSAETSFLQGAGAAVGKPALSAFSYTLQADAGLPAVLHRMVQGRSLPQATIEYVRADGDSLHTVMQLNLKDVFFVDMALSSADGDSAMVSESIVFGSMTQTIWAIDGKGKRAAPVSFSYDFARSDPTGPGLAAAVDGFGSGNLVNFRLAQAAGGVEAPPPGAPVGVVPEPQTWALMLAGIGGVLVLARRRQNAG